MKRGIRVREKRREGKEKRKCTKEEENSSQENVINYPIKTSAEEGDTGKDREKSVENHVNNHEKSF